MISHEPPSEPSQTPSEITQKNKAFRLEIRSRQKHNYFNSIRKQYQLMHNQQPNTSIQEYPLLSRTLEKYWHLSHCQLRGQTDEIARHLLEYNLYLSEFQKDSEEGIAMGEGVGEGACDQQTLLVQDLFYLVFETSFRFPRKFKFIRNGSQQVASFVAVVSAEIMPEQLAYWINYMSDEDKDIVYLAIGGTEESDSKMVAQQSLNMRRNLHYQSWVNHPVLRNHLLEDLPRLESAALAIREIVGFRGVHPDRLKNSKGIDLYQILCHMLEEQLQGMREIKPNSSPSARTLLTQHLEITIKVLQAKYLCGQPPEQLAHLLNKILTSRLEQKISPISPLFCLWVMNALLDKNLFLLSQVGNRIMLDLLSYDWEGFINRAGCFGGGLDWERVGKFQGLVREKFGGLGVGDVRREDQDLSDGEDDNGQFSYSQCNIRNQSSEMI